MKRTVDLSGKWRVTLKDMTGEAMIPGTLDTNGLGTLNEKREAGRLTRRYEYDGAAIYEKDVFIGKEFEGRVISLLIERTRCARVFVNGKEGKANGFNSLATVNRFDVTDCVHFGTKNIIRVEVDNTYPNMPASSIIYSSTATDESQTNWNGMIGKVELQAEDRVFVSCVRVYPQENNKKVRVAITICNAEDKAVDGTVTVSSGVLYQNAVFSYHLEAGQECDAVVAVLDCKKDALEWSEYQPYLYDLTASTENSSYAVRFGLRSFGVSQDYKFTLNGRRLFLRGEANCCIFPLTGHPPMTVEEWRKVIQSYQEYGVSCLRFHSWCPPEAAFAAADEMGMFMQCELSNWNYKDNFEIPYSEDYYTKEAFAILREYANHPSFVMLTFGNELQAGEEGHAKMNDLLHKLRTYDPTRLYSDASNPHYGAVGPNKEADFFVAQQWGEDYFRGIFANGYGHINRDYPSLKTDYHDSIKKVHDAAQIPLMGFEVGQFEVCPDYTEIPEYKGCLIPSNLQIAQQRLQEKGRYDRYRAYTEASGQLSFLCYKEEVEASLRSGNMAGISLLGLQDFSGQGMALVGMMNAFLQPKPYDFSSPERFHEFFNDVVPLVIAEKRTYTNEECMKLTVKVANYSDHSICGESLTYAFMDGDIVRACGEINVNAPQGQLTAVGEIGYALKEFKKPVKILLKIRLGTYSNSYHFWVYPSAQSVEAEDVYCCEYLDDKAVRILQAGGKVFLQPKADPSALPHSIGGEFSTDFWCISTFKEQQGSMGLLINNKHKALSEFPTQYHSDWQWWAMTKLGRPMIIDGLSADVKPIIEVLDTFAGMNYMALLFECKVENGSLMVSSMDLPSHLEYPEVRALQKSILDYMNSADFAPETELELKEIQELIRKAE